MKEEDVQEKEQEDQKTLKKKFSVTTVIICVLVIIVLILIIVAGIRSKSSGVSEENNSANMGLVAAGDGYVFYNKDSVGLFKIKDGEEYQISDDRAYSMYYEDGYLYYTTANSTGGITIKKMTDNGDESWILINTPSSTLKTILSDGYLYYLTVSPNTISRIDTNGENEEVLLNRTISDFYVTDDTIYFVDDDNLLCRIDLNGDNYELLMDEQIASKFQMYNGKIYYYDEDNGLMKLDVKKQKTELVTDKVNSENYNVTNKGIFYYDSEAETICKVSSDGTNVKELVEISNANTKINIVGNILYYLDSDTTYNNKTCRIKINGNSTDEVVY